MYLREVSVGTGLALELAMIIDGYRFLFHFVVVLCFLFFTFYLDRHNVTVRSLCALLIIASHIPFRKKRGSLQLQGNLKASQKTRIESTKSTRTGTKRRIKSIRSTNTAIKTEVKIKTRTRRRILGVNIQRSTMIRFVHVYLCRWTTLLTLDLATSILNWQLKNNYYLSENSLITVCCF